MVGWLAAAVVGGGGGSSGGQRDLARNGTNIFKDSMFVVLF